MPTSLCDAQTQSPLYQQLLGWQTLTPALNVQHDQEKLGEQFSCMGWALLSWNLEETQKHGAPPPLAYWQQAIVSLAPLFLHTLTLPGICSPSLARRVLLIRHIRVHTTSSLQPFETPCTPAVQRLTFSPFASLAEFSQRPPLAH